MGLKRNEHGMLVRARDYGRTPYEDIARELGLRSDETLYAVSQENGVRVSRPVGSTTKEVSHKPGTSFVAGPTITKAAGFFGTLARKLNAAESAGGASSTRRGKTEIPLVLRREMEELRAAGLGSIPDPELSSKGWNINMKGLVLPGGCRTDARILLPASYPEACPIGFYIHKDANVGGLDTSHLYSRSYHGAPDLSDEGLDWFCGVAENWIPGRHTLLGYVSAVLSLFSERSAS